MMAARTAAAAAVERTAVEVAAPAEEETAAEIAIAGRTEAAAVTEAAATAAESTSCARIVTTQTAAPTGSTSTRLRPRDVAIDGAGAAAIHC